MARPGDVSTHFCGNHNQLSFTGSRTIFICDHGDQNRDVLAKTWCFLGDQT